MIASKYYSAFRLYYFIIFQYFKIQQKRIKQDLNTILYIEET